MIKESGIVERLEPCPFCGATDLTLTVDRHGWKVVECNDCGMKGPCIDLEGSEYLTRWNTRPAATLIAELQAERDRIKAFLSEGSWATIESEQAWKRRALAAESSLHRVRETAWQPIETAPMDGTHIFVCDQSDPSFSFSQRPPTVAHWFGPPDLPGLRSGGWYLSVSYNEQPRLQGLTHWQHLPAPPAVADTNADAPGNVGLLGGVSTDQTSLNITGLDTGAVKTAESRNSPSTREE